MFVDDTLPHNKNSQNQEYKPDSFFVKLDDIKIV